MPSVLRRVVLVATLMTAGCAFAEDQVLDLTIAPKTGVWQTGEYRLWVPGDVKVLRGVLVHFHGFSGDARTIVGKKPWQDAARQWGFALLGTHFWNGSNVDYRWPERGSGEALFGVLKDFAGRSGHPELEHAPVCFWGMSLGGATTQSFADFRPERVIAFAAVNGTGRNRKPQTLKTPGLLFAGGADPIVKPEGVTKMFETNRSAGALWALAMHWGVEHDTANSDALILPFFDHVLRARLPQDQTSEKGPVKLLDLDEKNGWLGSREDWKSTWATVAPFADYHGEAGAACWLPDGYVAAVWRADVAQEAGVRVKATGTGEALSLTAEGLPAGATGVAFYDGDVALGEGPAAGELKTDKLARGIHAVYVVWTADGAKRATSPPLLLVDGHPYPYVPKRKEPPPRPAP